MHLVPQTLRSTTPRAQILGHWNYAPGVSKDVYVVSNADSVELVLNGRSLGRGAQSHRFLHTFREVAWEPGKLVAYGFDRDGHKACEASHITAGEPAALKLTIQTAPRGLHADGADLALVQAEVVDERGQRCPTALHLVHFDIEGPAEWRGGIAQGPDNFILARSLPVECGVKRVLVRSQTMPGRIVVRARADGLKPAEVAFDSIATDVGPGDWSQQLPGDGLRGRLNRTEPRQPLSSFADARRPVGVRAVNAGSNAAEAAASFDDNEITSWTSSNDIAAAWIEFELERPAKLSEVVLKLGGWRERSYPVRILVDGVEVHRAASRRSLGYIGIPLNNARGQRVRIEMLDAAAAQDAFGITELEDQRNSATGATRIQARALSIVEAEFYEPAPAIEPASE